MKSTRIGLARLKRLLLLSGASFTLLPALLNAQNAGDYFHQGATNYIFGREQEALEVVEAGRKRYPNDSPLIQLERLLKKEKQDQQNQQQNQKDQQDQQKQDQQKPDQSKQDQQQQQKKKDDQQDSQKKDAQQQQNQQPDQKPGQQGDQKDKPDDQSDAEGTPSAVVRMTPKEAAQLLEAVKSDERIMPFQLQLKTNRLNRVFKDW